MLLSVETHFKFLFSTVIPNITFPLDGQLYTINEFNPVVFECTATGIPAPTITWYRGGVLLNGSRITLSDHSEPVAFSTQYGDIFLITRALIFDNTMDSDTGTYTCLADNSVEPSATQEFELAVKGNAFISLLHEYFNCCCLSCIVAPTILTPPVNLIVVQPQNPVFFCLATATPRPDITWFREEEDGSLVPVVEVDVAVVEEQEIGIRERNSTLTILGSLPSDTGTYVCRAENVVGRVEASATLLVHGKWSDVLQILCSV